MEKYADIEKLLPIKKLFLKKNYIHSLNHRPSLPLTNPHCVNRSTLSLQHKKTFNQHTPSV